MSIALTQRVKKLEEAANQPSHGLMERVAELERALVTVAKGAELVAERMTTLEGQYRALNARVGKALKKQE
jgi:hypothetical protein